MTAAAMSFEQTDLRLRLRIKLFQNLNIFTNYDSFINSAAFLSEEDRNRLLIIGNETIDNLITHSEIGLNELNIVLCKRKNEIQLSFFVQSQTSFRIFTKNIKNVYKKEIFFCEKDRRWHGLGLKMCTNLAREIHFRPGTQIDCIFIII